MFEDVCIMYCYIVPHLEQESMEINQAVSFSVLHGGSL